MIKPWPDSPPPQALLGACPVWTCSFIRHLDIPSQLLESSLLPLSSTIIPPCSCHLRAYSLHPASLPAARLAPLCLAVSLWHLWLDHPPSAAGPDDGEGQSLLVYRIDLRAEYRDLNTTGVCIIRTVLV